MFSRTLTAGQQGIGRSASQIAGDLRNQRKGRNRVLWFRPEVAATVTWAGNPEKAAVQGSNQLQLHPRASFQSRQEVVEGIAVPWRKVEVEAVAELRNCVLALDLQREFRRSSEREPVPSASAAKRKTWCTWYRMTRARYLAMIRLIVR
jgi:light-regulated signal transduction histidine kinase (bacteriophytochrome)